MNDFVLVEEPLASELVDFYYSQVKYRGFLPISNCSVFEYPFKGYDWRFMADKSSLDLIHIIKADDPKVRVNQSLFVEPLIKNQLVRLEAQGADELKHKRKEMGESVNRVSFKTRIRHWDVWLEFRPTESVKFVLEHARWINPDELGRQQHSGNF